MRLSRAAIAVVIVLASMAGCIENMGDLKEALGALPPPPPPEVFEAPLAKAQAPVTAPVVGAPVTFLSDGSSDPKGLALLFAWDFGDGAKAWGATATHAYAEPGEYVARLVVTNSAGLSDTDSVALRVLPADRAPTVAIRVMDAAGLATERGSMGAPLTFSAVASDPEGRVVEVLWSFGDGGSAQEASATHAYDAPGFYDVRVSAKDAAGQVASASTRLAIDASWSEEGTFAPVAGDVAEVPFVAVEGARIAFALSFEAGTGLHDLELVVLDEAGGEVARTDAAAQPGAQGEATRELVLERAPGSGAWTARVVREQGLSVAWSLDIVERV